MSLVLCDVPQGIVLGPILFLLYCAHLTYIVERLGVTAHSDADNTQLYVHYKIRECTTEASRLTSCIEELDIWMASNRLQLNSDKPNSFGLIHGSNWLMSLRQRYYWMATAYVGVVT